MAFSPRSFSNHVIGSSFMTNQLTDFGRFGGFGDMPGGNPLADFTPGEGVRAGRIRHSQESFNPPPIPGSLNLTSGPLSPGPSVKAITSPMQGSFNSGEDISDMPILTRGTFN